jgi:hypothetical protein
MEKISEKFLETLSNKKIEEIFKETEVMNNKLGEFVKITNPFGVIEEKHIINNQELILLEGILKQNLNIMPGIGSKKLREYHKKQYFCLDDLVGLSPKYSKVSEILEAISGKNVNELKKNSRIKEEELLFCVDPEDILFLDIETTGQTAGISVVFLIGIGYLKKDENKKFKFTTELLFAREIAEEAAILKYFTDILPKFKMLVTYNGKSFDIPFLRERIGALFEPEDISDVYDFFKENTLLNSSITPDLQYPSAIAAEIFSSYIHFDLYYALRRTYKVLLENYRLITAEEKILDFHRIDNLPSSEVPQVYTDWLSDKGKNMGALYKVLEHNFYDVFNMEKLLKEYLLTRIDDAFKLIQPAIKEKQLVNELKNDLRGRKEDIYKLINYFNSKKKVKIKTLDNYL